jgi:hypothetical protein
MRLVWPTPPPNSSVLAHSEFECLPDESFQELIVQFEDFRNAFVAASDVSSEMMDLTGLLKFQEKMAATAINMAVRRCLLLLRHPRPVEAPLQSVDTDALEHEVAGLVSVILAHVSDFDRNGVVTWKGTQGNTRPLKNPQKTRAVATAASSESYYEAHRLVQNEPDGQFNITKDKPGQWMAVDLLRDALEVNYYCLRHGSSDGKRRLRSWELQGRKGNSAGWVTLCVHTGDRALGEEGFATAGWAVVGGKGSFSQFRVFMTGPNSNGGNHLCCAGIELYGTLVPGGS